VTTRAKFALFVVVFALAYYIPFGNASVKSAVFDSLLLLQDYARRHVLFCLVPAFFIAGAIGCFVSQASVVKYFGAQASRALAYGAASVSGTILAVCSCTVLPLFAGIYRRGAGIGPATAFLYSGPAINVLAIILTARVLGLSIGIARGVGAIVFAVVIGLLMSVVFRREEAQRAETAAGAVIPQEARPLGQTVVYFATMVLILIFAAWGKPEGASGAWAAVYRAHWCLAGALLVLLGLQLRAWFTRDELREWVSSTWGFAELILPLLLGGVLVAGFLMGSPGGGHGIIPPEAIDRLVGGNSLRANFLASIVGALMYFATLTEVPILQGLISSGMGKGPALALLLAGPALSLPNMLVIRGIMGSKKTLVYIGLVVVMSTAAGMLFGALG
jgi:uncharacterized membrane protein YraQ (UPF0718 family)